MKPFTSLAVFYIIIAVFQWQYFNILVLGFRTTTHPSSNTTPHSFSTTRNNNVISLSSTTSSLLPHSYYYYCLSEAPTDTTRLCTLLNIKTVLSFSVSDNDSTLQKLSRPEKKARERQRKEQKLIVAKGTTTKSIGSRINNNGNKKQQQKKKGVQQQTAMNTNSSEILLLDPQDIRNAIKRAQYMHDERSLVFIQKSLLDTNATNEKESSLEEDTVKCSLLARLAVAFLNIYNHRRALEVIHIRKTVLAQRQQQQQQSVFIPSDSAAIIRALLRCSNSNIGSSSKNTVTISNSTIIEIAMNLLEEELPLPTTQETTSPQNEQPEQQQHQHEEELIKYRSLTLLSIASCCFKQGGATKALKACDMLRLLGPMVVGGKNPVQMPWLKLIQSAAYYESQHRSQNATVAPANVVYSVLDCMNTFPSENDDLVYEALSNSLVRRVEFVTGAVSMKDLPPPDRGEAAFIGRSNVGKSSLVNMVRTFF